MNTKIMLVLSVGFNAALLGALTFVCRQIPECEMLTARGAWVAKSVSASDIRTAQLDAFAPRTGAVIEALLPEARPGEPRDLFNFETGRRVAEPVFDANEARGGIAWIRNQGLDVSGVILQNGEPACLGCYLAAVPVNRQLWETIAPGDLQAHPELDKIVNPKRTFLVPGQSKTDTFLFRTADGTSGILQVQGVTEDRRCVRIRYKLLSPVQTQLAHHAAAGTAGAGVTAQP